VPQVMEPNARDSCPPDELGVGPGKGVGMDRRAVDRGEYEDAVGITRPDGQPQFLLLDCVAPQSFDGRCSVRRRA